MKVAIIDHIHPCLKETLEAQGYECMALANKAASEIPGLIESVDGIVVRSKMKIDAGIIDNCPNLKFIGRVGAGLEAIDVAYAESKGIVCLNSPEGNRVAVGEHALGMLLALFNNLIRGDAEIRNGIWEREANRGYELAGRTVGIIGYGNMGSAFAERLAGFEAPVIAYDKYKTGFGTDLVKEVTLEELQQQADVVSIHVPLTEETHQLVNSNFMNAFAKPIYLINTARGKIVSIDAVKEGLENGKVLGACLDVLEYENFLLDGVQQSEGLEYLKQSDRVILSPHVAGLTHESYYKLSAVLAEKIIARFP